jgi:hypothetical protein
MSEQSNQNCQTTVDPICPECGMRSHNGAYHYTWCSKLKITLKEGWICPKCSKVWGPQIKECEDCNKRYFVPLTTAEVWMTS